MIQESLSELQKLRRQVALKSGILQANQTYWGSSTRRVSGEVEISNSVWFTTFIFLVNTFEATELYFMLSKYCKTWLTLVLIILSLL